MPVETVSPTEDIGNQSRAERVSMSAYKELLELVHSSQVEIVHILSTPRSSSTALERALFQSDDVHLQINDAWANHDSDSREQATYQQILFEIKEELKEKEKIKVIVKSVADYIPPGESFERMCELSSHTIVLTRNPLLQMESMMRIMGESIESDRILVGGLTMNEYSQSLGYDNWQDMRTKVNQTKSYYKYEPIYSAFFPIEQEIHKSAVMRLPILHNLQESVINTIGYGTKDDYASSHGFVDWQHFLDSIDRNPDSINDHGELIRAIFLCRITGWDAMLQHVVQLENSNYHHTVIDSTMFRAKPEYYLEQLARRAGLAYGESVVNWSVSHKQFNPGDDEGVSYYQKVIESSGVQPPNEVPMVLNHFPTFIQNHLSENGGAFSTYLKLLEKHIHEFGEEQTRDLMKVVIDGVSLQDIDPVFVYAMLKVMNMGDASQFKEKYPQYREEFNLIDRLEEKNNE